MFQLTTRVNHLFLKSFDVCPEYDLKSHLRQTNNEGLFGRHDQSKFIYFSNLFRITTGL